MHVVDSEHHIICLKQIAFNLLDMNSDNSICDYDLFSLIKHTTEPVYLGAVKQDVNDIRAAMQNKEQHRDDSEFKIANVEEWLHERHLSGRLRQNFH